MALPKADIPRSKADVEGWCRKLQDGCLNEDARQLVGAAAEQYIAMFEGIERARDAESALDYAMQALEQDPGSELAKFRLNVALTKYKQTGDEIAVRHKLGPVIDKMVGRAQAANHAESDAAIVQLRQFAAQREQLVANFGPAHKLGGLKAKAEPKAAKAPRKPKAKGGT